MSTFSSSREALLAALKQYTSVLRERNSAIDAVSRSTYQMRQRLLGRDSAGIEDILDRRAAELARLETARRGTSPDLDRLIEAACSAASGDNGEISDLAGLLVALQTDYQTLAQGILLCQQECETLMRRRLEETGRLIKESTTRRKLDAAYGPAVCHQPVAVYMDRQQ